MAWRMKKSPTSVMTSSICPSEETREAAAYVARHPGGHGAVRDVIEFILKAQGRWKDVIASFYDVTGEAPANKLAQ